MNLRGLAFGLALVGCESTPQVTIVDEANQEVLAVEVDLAETVAERTQGLRGRNLAGGRGLLIVLPGESEVCINNQGVEIDIDAVFIDDGERVSAVERNIRADDSRDRCYVARYILELNAGSASSVEPGQTALLP